jgi:hypothetical protein
VEEVAVGEGEGVEDGSSVFSTTAYNNVKLLSMTDGGCVLHGNSLFFYSFHDSSTTNHEQPTTLASDLASTSS